MNEGDKVTIQNKKFRTEMYQSYAGKQGVVTGIHNNVLFDVSFDDGTILMYYVSELV